MSRTTFLRVIAAAVAYTANARAQQLAAMLPTVTTNGSAQIRVIPDLADLSFEVEVRGGDLVATRKEQAERATKVLATLRAAGVTETALQSSSVQIHCGLHRSPAGDGDSPVLPGVADGLCHMA